MRYTPNKQQNIVDYTQSAKQPTPAQFMAPHSKKQSSGYPEMSQPIRPWTMSGSANNPIESQYNRILRISERNLRSSYKNSNNSPGRIQYYNTINNKVADEREPFQPRNSYKPRNSHLRSKNTKSQNYFSTKIDNENFSKGPSFFTGPAPPIFTTNFSNMKGIRAGNVNEYYHKDRGQVPYEFSGVKVLSSSDDRLVKGMTKGVGLNQSHNKEIDYQNELNSNFKYQSFTSGLQNSKENIEDLGFDNIQFKKNNLLQDSPKNLNLIPKTNNFNNVKFPQNPTDDFAQYQPWPKISSSPELLLESHRKSRQRGASLSPSKRNYSSNIQRYSPVNNVLFSPVKRNQNSLSPNTDRKLTDFISDGSVSPCKIKHTSNNFLNPLQRQVFGIGTPTTTLKTDGYERESSQEQTRQKSSFTRSNLYSLNIKNDQNNKLVVETSEIAKFSLPKTNYNNNGLGEKLAMKDGYRNEAPLEFQTRRIQNSANSNKHERTCETIAEAPMIHEATSENFSTAMKSSMAYKSPNKFNTASPISQHSSIKKSISYDRVVETPVYHDRIEMISVKDIEGQKRSGVKDEQILPTQYNDIVNTTTVDNPIFIENIIQKIIQVPIEKVIDVPKMHTTYKKVNNMKEVPKVVENIIEKEVIYNVINQVPKFVYNLIENPIIKERLSHRKVPKEVIKEKEVKVDKEEIVHVSLLREKVLKKEIENIVEVPVKRFVEVPVYWDYIVEKPKYVDKIIEVRVDKIVEKRYEVEKIVEVPVEKVIEVKIERYYDNFIENPIEKIIEVPVDKIVENIIYVDNIIEREVPVIKVIDKEVINTIEVPKIIEKIVETTKIIETRIEKKVEVIVERIIEVPVEKITKIEVEKLVPKYKNITREVEKIIEKKVDKPVEKIIEVEEEEDQSLKQKVKEVQEKLLNLKLEKNRRTQELKSLKVKCELKKKAIDKRESYLNSKKEQFEKVKLRVSQLENTLKKSKIKKISIINVSGGSRDDTQKTPKISDESPNVNVKRMHKSSGFKPYNSAIDNYEKTTKFAMTSPSPFDSKSRTNSSTAYKEYTANTNNIFLKSSTSTFSAFGITGNYTGKFDNIYDKKNLEYFKEMKKSNIGSYNGSHKKAGSESDQLKRLGSSSQVNDYLNTKLGGSNSKRTTGLLSIDTSNSGFKKAESTTLKSNTNYEYSNTNHDNSSYLERNSHQRLSSRKDQEGYRDNFNYGIDGVLSSMKNTYYEAGRTNVGGSSKPVRNYDSRLSQFNSPKTTLTSKSVFGSEKKLKKYSSSTNMLSGGADGGKYQMNSQKDNGKMAINNSLAKNYIIGAYDNMKKLSMNKNTNNNYSRKYSSKAV